MRYRLDRALKILQLLQNGGVYDPVGLTVELKVNRRTVYRDIALLREMGIPIEFDHSISGYVVRQMNQGSERSVETDTLRRALDVATSSERSATSVDAIIRHVALFLAGSEEDPNLESGDTEAPPGAFNSAWEKRVQEMPLSRTRFDNASRRDQSSEWSKTEDCLSALCQAIRHGDMIETSDADVFDSNDADSLHLVVPREAVISGNGVIVSGIDRWGNSIRVRSVSLRFVTRFRDSGAQTNSH